MLNLPQIPHFSLHELDRLRQITTALRKSLVIS